jgi:hypothetical protein
VQDVIPTARAETGLEQWQGDYDRRRWGLAGGTEPAPAAQEESRERRSEGADQARTEVEATREERIYATAERETAPRPVAAVTPPAGAEARPAREEPPPVRADTEPVHAQEPAGPPETAPAPAEEPVSELEGLEPSRLRGRTTRGRRR